MSLIIAVDPGRNKCGLILADPASAMILEALVLEVDDVMEVLQSWHEKGQLQALLLGNGTNSHFWQQKLGSIAPVTLVDEYGTTLRARERYWELWPPQGFKRLLPRGMIQPPIALDAIAALVMLEDHLQCKMSLVEKG